MTEDQAPKESPSAAPTGSPPWTNLTPRLQQAISMAVVVAKEFEHSYTGTEHMLIALIRIGRGVAHTELEAAGITESKVRKSLGIEDIPGHKIDRAFKSWFHEHWQGKNLDAAWSAWHAAKNPCA